MDCLFGTSSTTAEPRTRLLGTLVPVSSPANSSLLDLSSTQTASSPLAFGSFLSTVRSSGLRILRSLDATTLLRFAEQALVLEEEVATGCLLIQGIALLEHFHRSRSISPLDWPDQAIKTGPYQNQARASSAATHSVSLSRLLLCDLDE